MSKLQKYSVNGKYGSMKETKEGKVYEKLGCYSAPMPKPPRIPLQIHPSSGFIPSLIFPARPMVSILPSPLVGCYLSILLGSSLTDSSTPILVLLLSFPVLFIFTLKPRVLDTCPSFFIKLQDFFYPLFAYSIYAFKFLPFYQSRGA